MTMLTDVATALAAEFGWIINVDAGRTIFRSSLPDDTPDPVVAIYQYQGEAPLYTMGRNGSPANRRPRLQVRVRGSDADLAMMRATEIMKFLETIVEDVLSGTKYNRIAAVGEPFETGVDSSGRENVITNYRVMMEHT